jgi:hypothetical protein
LIDCTSGIFLRDLLILSARDLFKESEPTARKAYFDFTPKPRASGFGPGVIYEHETGESLARNWLLPVGRRV